MAESLLLAHHSSVSELYSRRTKHSVCREDERKFFVPAIPSTTVYGCVIATRKDDANSVWNYDSKLDEFRRLQSMFDLDSARIAVYKQSVCGN